MLENKLFLKEAGTFDQMSTRPPAVRAIVIWGLPDNIQERELPNLLWALPGYHDCWMRTRNKAVTGFARFMTPDAALSALKKLHYHTFDSVHQIKCDLACKDPRAGEVRQTFRFCDHPAN